MSDGIDILLEYLNKYKDFSIDNPEKNMNKEIDNLIKSINDRRYIVKYDLIERIVRSFEKSDIDSILYDVMLNVNRYNLYLMNKNVKFAEPNVNKDIEFEDIKIDVSDILNYLEVKEEDLDIDLIKDLKKYVNKDKFMEFAKIIKTSNNVERALYDNIIDKNELVAILLHSDIKLIRGVINALNNKNINLNKFINNMPSIFIATKVNDKCKFPICCGYSNFMGNMANVENYNLDYKKIMNFSVFLLNDVSKNNKYIKSLSDMRINVKNVLEHCGNIFALKPETVLNNIAILKYHNIELTDDSNNNGYTLLGMNDLDTKINYLIESKLWKLSDGDKHDNIDLIRALIIKDDYLKWKSNYKYDIIENAPFKEKTLSEESINYVYEKYPILIELDSKYLVEGNYVLNGNVISKYRLINNLNNYVGKDDALLESLKYKSNVSNIEEVIEIFSSLKEIGDDSVKLSKRI